MRVCALIHFGVISYTCLDLYVSCVNVGICNLLILYSRRESLQNENKELWEHDKCAHIISF